MELFYAYKIVDGFAWLDAEESAHCVRVLRHRTGDEISVIGPFAAACEGVFTAGECVYRAPFSGARTRLFPAADGKAAALYRCVISDDSPKGVVARVESVQEGWGGHPYYLRMAVCPTKNIDRYEWFVEKAVELGVDEIIPMIGEHSERRVVRVDRLQKIAISAAKQSLKGSIPVISDPVSVLDFIASQGVLTCSAENASQSQHPAPLADIRLIAYCSDDVAPRGSIVDALAAACEGVATAGECRHRAPFSGAQTCLVPAADGKAAACVTVLIGPEGDFSQDEVRAAIAAGFEPVHLGPSRLRTETAAITAVEAAYFTLGLASPAYDSEKPCSTQFADTQ